MPSPHGHTELILVLYLKMVSFFIDRVWGERYRPAKTRFQVVLHYFYTSKNYIKCLREMPAILSRKVIKIKRKNNVEYGWYFHMTIVSDSFKNVWGEKYIISKTGLKPVLLPFCMKITKNGSRKMPAISCRRNIKLFWRHEDLLCFMLHPSMAQYLSKSPWGKRYQLAKTPPGTIKNQSLSKLS